MFYFHRLQLVVVTTTQYPLKPSDYIVLATTLQQQKEQAKEQKLPPEFFHNNVGFKSMLGSVPNSPATTGNNNTTESKDEDRMEL